MSARLTDSKEVGCLCKGRGVSPEFPLSYPTLTAGGDPEQLLHEDGYFVIRNLFTEEEVEECRKAVTDVCLKWYARYAETGKEGLDWEEVANRRPAWKNGTWHPEPGQEVVGFRRLYRMTPTEPFFAKMCKHEKVS